MKARVFAALAPMVLIALAFLPGGAAGSAVNGTVTNCASNVDCYFVINSTAGSGWANATGTTFSFQLPGEAKASYNLSYSTYIQSLTGTYTYWTVGNFVGTDVNSGYVVYGVTNTNFTITCVGHSGRGGGCTYVYTTDNGTIAFRLTHAELTSTSVACSPSSFVVGKNTSCTVTVSNLWNASKIPTGKVHVVSSLAGSFSNRGNCLLSSGQCSVSWRPADNSIGTATITASYAGSSSFYKSSGSTTVTVGGGGP